MNPIDTLTGLSGNWHWFILAAILLLFELFLPGVFLVWLAVSAVIMGFITMILPFAIDWQFQVLLFTILSIILVFVGKRYLKYGQMPDLEGNGLNQRGRRLVGNIVTVDKVTSPDRGKAKIGDSVWTIAGNDLVQGAEMQVVDIEGNVLVVEPVA